MDALTHLAQGFGVLLQLKYLGFCFAGVLVGQIIGALPGIGPSAAIAILLPLTFGGDATNVPNAFGTNILLGGSGGGGGGGGAAGTQDLAPGLDNSGGGGGGAGGSLGDIIEAVEPALPDGSVHIAYDVAYRSAR